MIWFTENKRENESNMSKIIMTDGDEGVRLIVKEPKGKRAKSAPPIVRSTRSPVHVVYGGADRFSAATPRKLGDIALKTLETYAPNFSEFALAMDLPGCESLPTFRDAIEKLDRQIARNKGKAKQENYAAWFAWTVYQKTVAKLTNEPVEDLRIDFEDGYGFRPDEEEDRDAERAAIELARSVEQGTVTKFTGFRVKSFQPETYDRAVRTLELFLSTLFESAARLPENFVVTLPKIIGKKQVRDLADQLGKFEKRRGLPLGSIGIELMIETPESLIGRKGNFVLKELVAAGRGRVTSAHFGAYDYTAALGISAADQHIRHEACNFARQLMLINLVPLNVRLVDSVTTKLPVPIHSGRLNQQQKMENQRSIHGGWAEHFDNVIASMRGGFYQSWDLHPNQLPARYAAVYSYFLTGMDPQADRLKAFMERATRATLSGNTFDDAASAQGILNFFVRGMDCGAFTEKEEAAATGLSPVELRSSFQTIAAGRK
jgi:Citrate lyase beta subunit